jgi:hypothetical protein
MMSASPITDHRWRRDGPDGLDWQVRRTARQVLHLGHKHRPIVWIRGELAVVRLDWGTRECFGREGGLQARQYLGVDAFLLIADRAHQLAHEFRAPGGELPRGGGPHAEAEGVSAVDFDVAEEDGGIVGQLLVAQWAVDVGGAPVSLLVDRDDLASLGQHQQQRPEHFERAHQVAHQGHQGH